LLEIALVCSGPLKFVNEYRVMILDRQRMVVDDLKLRASIEVHPLSDELKTAAPLMNWRVHQELTMSSNAGNIDMLQEFSTDAANCFTKQRQVWCCME
jgi:hypothetical protein